MKTISVKELSKTSISLSTAASTLSNFVSVDNGASNTVTAHLRRSLDAFTELTQLHKDLRKHKKKPKLEANEEASYYQLGHGSGEISEEKVNREIKLKRKKRRDGGEAKIERVEVSQVNESRQGLNRNVKETNVVDSFDGKAKNEAESEKPRHKKKNKDIDNVVESEGQVEKENKKKCKNRETEDEGKDNSEVQRKKKIVESNGVKVIE